MSLELARETLKLNQVINEDWSQAVIDSDIIVPDSKPDIARVLLIDGDVFVSDTEAYADRVSVNGNFLFKILYVSDDEEQNLRSINTNVNFSHSLDLENSRSGLKPDVRCEVEHIEYSLLNGRKINVRAVLKVQGRVLEEKEQEIVYDVSGVEGVQVLRDSFSLSNYLGENSEIYTFRESTEIPAGKPTVREVLRNDIKITGKDFKISDNKIIAKGDISVSTLYTGDDEKQSINIVEYEIPFSQFIDLPGLDEESFCDVRFEISDYKIDAAEDSDGELRVMDSEISVRISAEGYTKKDFQGIVDAYCPEVRLTLAKENLKTREVISENKSQVILKDTLVINEGLPEISEVLNILSNPAMVEYDYRDDKLVLEGAVSSNILYLTGGERQLVYCSEQQLPFKHYMDVKGFNSSDGCDISIEVEHCNYSVVSSSEVEVRLVLGVGVKVTGETTVPVVVKVNELSEEDKKTGLRSSMVIYFAEPGDTLWEIAKRYLTTVEDLRAVNDLSDKEELVPGQQVLILRK